MIGLSLLALLGGASRGRADTYEWERTERLLHTLGLELAPAPEGKRVAWVRVVRDEIFVEDEVWPLWFNWFHKKTHEDVVRRELLFREQEPYRDALIEETMRNLRQMGIFALVRIVPVKTEHEDAVGVVVHTRDLWSLRLEQSFNVTTLVNDLALRLTERNLWGRNKTIGADFYLFPKTYTLREFYYARRVWGSDVSLSQSAGIIFNRARREAEGSLWNLSVGEPFYKLSQRYAYGLDVDYDTQVVRLLSNGQTRVYQPEPEGEAAYQVYRQERRSAALSGFYRRGEHYKQTFGVGWDYREIAARANAETDLPEGLREAFARDVLPKQRRENGPAFSYEIWMPRYVTFVNLATYGQSENIRVGPSAKLSLRAPLEAFGSSSHSWVLGASMGFVAAPKGALLELRVSGTTRYEEQRLVDQRGTVLVRGATPVFGPFRLVARGALDARRNDTARTLVTLGGDNGLRGYQSQFFAGLGASSLLANVELRTLPIEWQALHLGGVLFYDVGSVFTDIRHMRMHHAVGVGIRFLFPQFSRYPFSLDGGVSADPDFRFVPTFASSQVVPLTAVEDAARESRSPLN